MKKSKIVTIGLLALSLSACHHRRVYRHPAVGDWNNDPNYYVSDDDYGYYQPCYPGYPFFYYYSWYYHPGWGVMSRPGVSYYSYSRTSVSTRSGRFGGGGWHTSEGGHVSRGGFGSSGGRVGA